MESVVDGLVRMLLRFQVIRIEENKYAVLIFAVGCAIVAGRIVVADLADYVLKGESELFSGRPDSASKRDIIDYVRKSKNFDPKTEDLTRAEALLIFITSKQQTWLVSTSERLYCILDDIRKDEPHINWSISRSRIFQDNVPTISLEARDKTELTGFLDIGDTHRGWLYTKRLFSEKPVQQRVLELLESTMGIHA